MSAHKVKLDDFELSGISSFPVASAGYDKHHRCIVDEDQEEISQDEINHQNQNATNCKDLRMIGDL